MNRREFIKQTSTSLIAVIGAFHAPLIPHRLLAAPRRSDPESRYCYWVMESMHPIEAIQSLKTYGFTACDMRGGMSGWFVDFINRQPEVAAWLKARIFMNDPERNEYSRMWHSIKTRPSTPGKVWYMNMARKHAYAMNKFGLPISKDFVARHDQDMQELYGDIWDKQKTFNGGNNIWQR